MGARDAPDPRMIDLFDDFLPDYEGNNDVGAAMQELGLASITECIEGMVIPLLKHQVSPCAYHR